MRRDIKRGQFSVKDDKEDQTERVFDAGPEYQHWGERESVQWGDKERDGQDNFILPQHVADVWYLKLIMNDSL